MIGGSSSGVLEICTAGVLVAVIPALGVEIDERVRLGIEADAMMIKSARNE